ncbi:unnamed protein product, partial [Prunus brigantina]
FTWTRASIATTKSSVFHTSSQKSTWIINSGATYHMTFDPGQLISCKSFTPSVVSNANGTLSLVVGEGYLSLSTSLHLYSVLLVPSLNHNLLSVTQLTTTLGCIVTFWSNHCVFQDILKGKTIGCGTQQDKLYYFDWAWDSETKVEEEIKPFYEILPAPENSSALVPHQSPVEEVIQVTSFPETDNTNEISHDDLISKGIEPTYQLPEKKNRGKSRVQYEADLKAKGNYPINNYISLSRLS